MTTRSPVHQWHVENSPLCTDDVDALQSLALCDVSGLPKVGIKGPDAESFLVDQGIDVPASTYDWRRLADGGLIVRLGSDEFMIEDSEAGETVRNVSASIDTNIGSGAARLAYRVERQEATFLLIGSKAMDVLSQTCGINFRDAPDQLVFTRVAGVSCGVFPELVNSHPAYRIWVDCTFALYLWEMLYQICDDLDGRVIDANCIDFESR